MARTESHCVSFWRDLIVGEITDSHSQSTKDKLLQESRVRRHCDDSDQRKTKRSGMDEAFGAFPRVGNVRFSPFDNIISLSISVSRRSRSSQRNNRKSSSDTRSSNLYETVKKMLRVGPDRIRNVIREFATTHEFPLPKPIGRQKVLTADGMAMINTQTAVHPAMSCAQLRKFLELHDIHMTSESVRGA
jgi:hypothetical protein